jgi:hemolysin activation/secretion protein
MKSHTKHFFSSEITVFPKKIGSFYLRNAWTVRGVLSASACFGTLAVAQTLPGAGVLQQQIEREQQGAAQRLQIQPQGKAATEAPTTGQTVVVQAFKFEGNTLLSNDQLTEALSTLVGKPLDFARLQSSAVLVADLYRSKGWVVQTYLPEQDIARGEVRIAIVEAVFGQARITGEAIQRVSPQRVLDTMAKQQATGQFLSMNALDRGLLLADDLPGVSVSGSLAPGQQNGQTDLLLQLADEPLLTGSLLADNTGSVSTGSNRALATFSLNSPAGLGDAMSLSLMSTPGSRYGRASYSLPLGVDGWRVGVNASRLDYELVSADYASLNASGYSNTAGAEITYPLVRSRSFNLNSSLSAEHKKYFNVSGGATTSAYSNTPVSLGLSGNSFDALGTGGANAFSAVVTAGSLNLNGSATQEGDANTTRTAGKFAKLRYSLSRQQQLDSSVSLYTALSGQWAQKNLDSSEKFYLGGSTGVRAYPSSEGGGSKGQLLNIELRWQLPEGLNLVGFYDHGQVTQNVNNNYSGAPELNRFSLKGAGLSLGWRHASGLNFQATYARRIGQNPNAITNDVNRGADQDGTLHRDRFWLTASVAF